MQEKNKGIPIKMNRELLSSSMNGKTTAHNMSAPPLNVSWRLFRISVSNVFSINQALTA